jgi:acid phosphatase type 7
MMGVLRRVVLLVVVGSLMSCSTTRSTGDVADVSPDVGVADNSVPLPDQQAGEVVLDVEVLAKVEVVDTVGPQECQAGVVEWPVAGEADETFEIGPYLMDSRPESIIIAWRTVDTVMGKVNFGPDDTLANEASDDEAKRYHQILLEGLVPGTRYAYQVSTSEKTSATHHFVTPVAGQPARFVVWGDNQSGYDNFTQLQPQIEARAPHAVLGVGDLISKGKTESLWLLELFGPARALLHDVPLFAAIGNHEENASFWYDFFAYPAADVPDDINSEAYYSFTFGNVFFLVINTNTVFFPIGEVDTPVSAWIKEQVASPAAQQATWRIAYGHEPGITESWSAGNCKYDGYKPIRNWFLPFIAEHGFHLYMAGHTHAYERAQMDTGLVQIITGGGGGGLDEWCKDFPETTVVYQNHHFLAIEADCDRLRIEVESIDGKIIDWLELDANQPGVLVDHGPAEGLPELIISSDSPTRKAE